MTWAPRRDWPIDTPPDQVEAEARQRTSQLAQQTGKPTVLYRRLLMYDWPNPTHSLGGILAADVLYFVKFREDTPPAHAEQIMEVTP